MPIVIFAMCIVVGVALIIYAIVMGYNFWRKHKYGPIEKNIGFEGKRFRILKHLSDKNSAINRLNVIEDLEIDIPTFKRVVNSLVHDKLIATGSQSIKITSFGKKYHDVFLK